VDLSLSPELQAFRDEVRSWLTDHLVGEFAANAGVGGPVDDTGWDVRLAWDRELAAGGWLCLGWPKRYGGREASVDEQLVFQLEYARANPPARATTSGLDLLGPTLLAYASDPIKDRFLPGIADASEFWGQGFSEPGAGSDLAGIRTKAVRDGDEWVLDGQKIWMSGGARAHWLYVLCRTDPHAPRHRGLSMVLIKADAPGIDIRPIRNLTGGVEFCEVFFTGARTPADLVVGEVNRGWDVAMGALGTERGTTLLAEQLTAVREVGDLIASARELGLSADPVLRGRLAQAWIECKVMQWNSLRLMTTIKRDPAAAIAQASISKVYASGSHQRMGELSMSVLGAASELVTDSYELSPPQRTFLASRAESIYGGTTQVQLNILAERSLGLPREPRSA
jgi:alkylation response protein AidB-like acyl-CoA dehydrogenase